jgi:6-pyruvoyltetrahydropterin/6-carboxytetrahydropterin synthase
MRTTVIELAKEEMKFSAGHFTIFGAGHRENFHGHNFTVAVAIAGLVDETQGMLSAYGEYKRWIIERCRLWNETFMLPTQSPHLHIETNADGSVVARFGDETLHFLARDVSLMPAANITLEELSRLFGEGLIEDRERLMRDRITSVVVKCSSGPGQSASWQWEKT